MENDLKKMGENGKNGRQPQQKMEDNPTKMEDDLKINGRRPQKKM